MTSLAINPDNFPALDGKTAIITGGSSGIGLAAAKIFASRGAHVNIVDLNPPEEDLDSRIKFHKCDITSWTQLRSVFDKIPYLDFCIANAGVSEDGNYLLDDTYDNEGKLAEPSYKVLEVNYRSVLNFVKLSIRKLKPTGGGGIVITTSATAYAPEQSLPVYSSTKLALIGLIRALRPTLHLSNITINGVAPAATITKLLPEKLASPLMAAGLPVSQADFVGRAVVFSAVGHQQRPVEPYGKDSNEHVPGRWNGRVILTYADTYTELEENVADLRPFWFGKENAKMTRMQQAATDFRPLPEENGAMNGHTSNGFGGIGAEKARAKEVTNSVNGVNGHHATNGVAGHA